MHIMNRNDLYKMLQAVLLDYKETGREHQVDYKKFYLYSIITHSTAIEGSTVTEVENTLLFDQGIVSGKRTVNEINMNLDLKAAYEQSMRLARQHEVFSVEMLKSLSALVMKNTGATYNTVQGSFDASKGDLRLVGVTAGIGGRSYMNSQKVPAKLEEFCEQINQRRNELSNLDDIIAKYLFSFDAHYQLVTIHPWVDGNGRMSRLVMNQLQEEMGIIPVKVTKEHKDGYIQSLVDSREEESTLPFREFMYGEHIGNLRQEIFDWWKENSDEYIETKKETVSCAVKYASGKRGFPWLRDSFNELCKIIIPEKINDDPAVYRKMVADCVLLQCKTKIEDDKIDFIRNDFYKLADTTQSCRSRQSI